MPRDRAAEPCDNAFAESLVDSFKTELVTDRIWRTRSQLELAVVEYIGWFNHVRLHESLGDSRRPSTNGCTRPSSDYARRSDRVIPRPGPRQSRARLTKLGVEWCALALQPGFRP